VRLRLTFSSRGPEHLRWGTIDQESSQPLPGGDLVKNPNLTTTRATAEAVSFVMSQKMLRGIRDQAERTAASHWRAQHGTDPGKGPRSKQSLYVPSASFFAPYRPKTANARMTRPMPVSRSAIPTTMEKIEICSAM
jgi:hypothetical protein